MPTTKPAPLGRRERNKQDKLARITRAARELFERKGFAGATARAICRRARVATGTLFLYARDKRELLFLVFRDEARELLRAAAADERACESLPAALLRLLGRFFDFYARNPTLARGIADELFLRAREPAAMAALTQELLDRLTVLVERAQRRGEVRADVPAAEQAHAFFAHYALHAQVWLAVGTLDRRLARRALRRAIDLQIEGLAPRATRRKPPRGAARRAGRTAKPDGEGEGS